MTRCGVILARRHGLVGGGAHRLGYGLVLAFLFRRPRCRRNRRIAFIPPVAFLLRERIDDRPLGIACRIFGNDCNRASVVRAGDISRCSGRRRGSWWVVAIAPREKQCCAYGDRNHQEHRHCDQQPLQAAALTWRSRWRSRRRRTPWLLSVRRALRRPVSARCGLRRLPLPRRRVSRAVPWLRRPVRIRWRRQTHSHPLASRKVIPHP